MRVHGLVSVVQIADGREVRCAIRRVLKNLATDERNVLATGDRVWIRPELKLTSGVIETGRAARHGCLTRASRKRESATSWWPTSISSSS